MVSAKVFHWSFEETGVRKAAEEQGGGRHQHDGRKLSNGGGMWTLKGSDVGGMRGLTGGGR